jgi:hypothetical protein
MNGTITVNIDYQNGSVVYGVISLTNQFCILSVSFVSLWFLILIASFFQDKLYSRMQFIDKTQESHQNYIFPLRLQKKD